MTKSYRKQCAAAPLPSRGGAGVGSVTSSAEGLHAVSFAAFSPRPGLRPPRPLEGWGVAARCLLGGNSAAATAGGLRTMTQAAWHSPSHVGDTSRRALPSLLIYFYIFP